MESAGWWFESIPPEVSGGSSIGRAADKDAHSVLIEDFLRVFTANKNLRGNPYTRARWLTKIYSVLMNKDFVSVFSATKPQLTVIHAVLN